MTLNTTEINGILEKIRSEYATYSKQNPKAFDLAGFEKRYLQTLQMKSNVVRFLNDEVAFLEQLKNKYNELIAKKEASKGATINRIMDEAIARLEKYPKMDFHPLAKPELRYFYGAMRDFGDSEVPALIHVFRGTPEYNMFQDVLHTIEKIAVSRIRNQSPPRITEHIKALLDANGNQMLMEKDTQDVLKTTCLALKKVSLLCKECIDKNRISSEIMMRIDDKEYPKAGSYNVKTHKGALETVIIKCQEIIEDFRMTAIVGP
ncbi:hypothetical protein [Leptospira sp. GIMC2001]|uniref:hypothetical protein n=1 Tax=Leptospira sp. GIMC2001 TaxID=1513297 RepID=UPI00234AB3AA|nr:hypothetical protein [Leptospira sp. GIMC2001]WCL49311.1 hypothetical protein O4O04_18785 [Leptospira sp. GIMC2001]